MSPLTNKLLNPRILVGAAALLLVLVYYAPLWTIHLTAPQYRDGLGMYISINEIRGHDTHDLQNINILNHYIGMQPIEPDAVPELEWMPLILGALIITGLGAAIIGNRWVMGAWIVAFVALGIAGMVDFYMWKYDYGHNLSPDAPIKVPDMTYQPPLIGTKQLLNIRASSYPHLGTLFITVSVLLGALGVWRSFRMKSRGPEVSGGEGAGVSGEEGASTRTGRGTTGSAGPFVGARMAALSLLAALAVAACGAAEEADRRADGPRGGPDHGEMMVYGQDIDPFCGKEVDRVRWGGEIRTSAGDRLRFRSVECMAGYLLSDMTDHGGIESIRVVDFPDGWRLVHASDATFLHTPNLASPDGLNLMAIDRENGRMVRNLQDAYTGPLLDWDEVLGLVARRWEVAVHAGGCPEVSGAPAPTCG